MTGVLKPKPLPKRVFVTLTEALTWLLYDHPLELPELLSCARTTCLTDEELREALTQEWRQLADYACKGTVAIRARQIGSARDRRLNEDDLRNCRYVGWSFTPELGLRIDPFPFTFSGGFNSHKEPELRGFAEVSVSRADLLAYNKVRVRLGEPAAASSWKTAERWLRQFFETTEPMTGVKDLAVARMVHKFGVTKSRARELWTTTALDMDWPLRGRASDADKLKLQSIIEEGRL